MVQLTASVSRSENFDNWIKLATDNKINSSNSWNVALIDYFHDLSLLKEGDSINFQKASTTLDGCVKIYSSRIDSAASETGRLLSGLTSKRWDDKENTNEEGEEDNDEEEDENENGEEEDSERSKKKKDKRRYRTGNTIAKDFEQIRLRQAGKELYVDPIFRKAISDFDEGGASSLLTNMLKINVESRIVFSTTTSKDIETDDTMTASGGKNTDDDGDVQMEDVGHSSHAKESIDSLCAAFSGIAYETEDKVVCPSIEQLERITNEGASATELLEQVGAIDVSFAPVFVDNDNFDFGNDDDNDANDTRNRTQFSLYLDNDPNDYNETTGINSTLNRLFDENQSFRRYDDDADEDDIDDVEDRNDGNETYDNTRMGDLAGYFDTISSKNWRGGQHWKINRLKQFQKSANSHNDENDILGQESTTDKGPLSHSVEKVTRKRKEVPLIDFLTDENDIDEDELFAASTKILLPQSQWNSDHNYMLPNDFQFTTKKLVYLYLKPNQKINTILNRKKRSNRKNLRGFTGDTSKVDENLPADENFFAQTFGNGEKKSSDPLHPELDDNFFDDEGVDGMDTDFGGADDFDAEDIIGPDFGDIGLPDDDENRNGAVSSQSPILSQSQAKKKEGALNYSRVSKKVNIKLLKQNLWESLSEESRFRHKRSATHLDEDDNDDHILEDDKENNAPGSENDKSFTKNNKDRDNNSEEVLDPLNFKTVVRNVNAKYSQFEKSELSTSFYFICLLHLANENGFTIENNQDYTDLLINN